MTDLSTENAAVGLARIIVDNERHGGKSLTSNDIFRIYAQCLRKASAIQQRVIKS